MMPGCEHPDSYPRGWIIDLGVYCLVCGDQPIWPTTLETLAYDEKWYPVKRMTPDEVPLEMILADPEVIEVRVVFRDGFVAPYRRKDET